MESKEAVGGWGDTFEGLEGVMANGKMTLPLVLHSEFASVTEEGISVQVPGTTPTSTLPASQSQEALYAEASEKIQASGLLSLFPAMLTQQTACTPKVANIIAEVAKNAPLGSAHSTCQYIIICFTTAATRHHNPTLCEFCFTGIGRADIEGSKSDVAMNAWPPQASYPCVVGNWEQSDYMGPNTAAVMSSLLPFFQTQPRPLPDSSVPASLHQIQLHRRADSVYL
ncbi:hypothetical protein JZ751_016405 [Albula glossodonta]|uniref:Uncharacterized protein n=1 Tax=Albula glossodonta TaxID=121402 RepID=A0A8T2NNJ1_9TELE|nr:hypothetical protein JZ751_016405 [Albula glossodonta]